MDIQCFSTEYVYIGNSLLKGDMYEKRNIMIKIPLQIILNQINSKYNDYLKYGNELVCSLHRPNPYKNEIISTIIYNNKEYKIPNELSMKIKYDFCTKHPNDPYFRNPKYR